MYRDVVTVAKSFYRMTMVFPSLRLAYILGSLSGQMTKIIVDSLGADGSDYCVRLDNDFTAAVILCAVTTSNYLDMRRGGFDVSALRYEDLTARPLSLIHI